MIAVGEKRAIAVRGDYRPVEVNVGGRRVAGWQEQTVEGVTEAEFADTYNDRAALTVQGTKLEQDAEPTPEAPQPIHGTEAVVTVSNADTEPAQTTLPVLYGRDGVCDVMETDVIVGGVHRSRVTRRWQTLALTGNEGWAKYGTNETYYSYQATGINPKPPNVMGVYALSTHYPYKSSFGGLYYGREIGIYAGSINTSNSSVVIGCEHPTIEDFRAYLAAHYAAGTPVTVVYRLAEPVIELGDPIDIRSLPRRTIIGSADPFTATVKVIDRNI